MRLASVDALVGAAERADLALDSAYEPEGGAGLFLASAAADEAGGTDLGEHAVEWGRL